MELLEPFISYIVTLFCLPGEANMLDRYQK